jgi:hypothetical protein
VSSVHLSGQLLSGLDHELSGLDLVLKLLDSQAVLLVLGVERQDRVLCQVNAGQGPAGD